MCVLAVLACLLAGWLGVDPMWYPFDSEDADESFRFQAWFDAV